MSLVEQLNGYERSKLIVSKFAKCQGVIRYPSRDCDYRENADDIADVHLIKFELHELKNALLEHRRQHNIFESGDPVVSRCADKETRIFTYQETIGKNILVKCKKGKGYYYPKKWFSHATDAEIEAGKRLEVGCE